jgi:hypothetical protein
MFINLVILQKIPWYRALQNKKKKKIMARKDIKLKYLQVVKLGMIYCIYYLSGLDY